MTRQKVFGFENAKTVKGEKLGYITAIRYLAPANESGTHNACPMAGACKAVCLYTAGRGAFLKTQQARVDKTRWRFADKASHMEAAAHELYNAMLRARCVGLQLAVRVNGTSDLPGDAVALATLFPELQFYDYTKIVATLRKPLPANYHLTVSYDPQTVPWSDCEWALKRGVNVAVVFRDKIPVRYKGYTCINGDEHDLRFLDPKGVVVGLKAKGAAKKDTSGFVVAGRG